MLDEGLDQAEDNPVFAKEVEPMRSKGGRVVDRHREGLTPDQGDPLRIGRTRDVGDGCDVVGGGAANRGSGHGSVSTTGDPARHRPSVIWTRRAGR